MILAVKAVFVLLGMLFATLFGKGFDMPVLLDCFRDDPVEAAFRSESGADPWFCEHDGRFYYCYSTGRGIGVRESDSLVDLNVAPHRSVYSAPEGTAYSENYWAPELHYIDGAWYVYVAADNGNNENHRMYVLKSDSPTGEFTFCGKISDPSDRWAIDGTVMRYKGELYFIWSGWEADDGSVQNLYIAHMSDPCTIDSERVMISSPDKKWEKNGMAINEGPAALATDAGAYIVYSASGSWTDEYCLGMLRLVGDPMDASAWVKCPVPVFSAREGAYGPGHCSFVTDPGTGTRYIVYHAMSESGAGWGGRYVRLQSFTTLFGVPVFGKPATADDAVC